MGRRSQLGGDLAVVAGFHRREKNLVSCAELAKGAAIPVGCGRCYESKCVAPQVTSQTEPEGAREYAAKSGYRVAGIGRGPENGALAKQLGAFAYIDSRPTNAAEELQKLGGAKRS